MSIFSERLKNLRYRKGESQDDLGKALGKSREAVAKYEIGKSEPDLNSLTKLAGHYGVSIDYIIGSAENDPAIILTNPGLKAFEIYLQDTDFVQYIKLAIKIKECGIDIKDIESFIESILKYSGDSKKYKQKHP